MYIKKFLSSAAAVFICGTLLTACGENKPETPAEETVSSDVSISDTAAETEEISVPQSETETETEEIQTEPISEETLPQNETTLSEPLTEAETDNTPEPVPEEEIVFDDSTADEPVGSEFADMDEFLASDFFSIEGKETAAKDCPSYKMYSTLKSADKFIMELKASDGSSSVRYAVSGSSSLMERSSSAESDITVKYIVKNSRMYMLDDENKLAMYMPVDESWKESGSVKSVLESFQIDINQSSGIVSDVKIGGKSYVLEVGSYTALLFNADGSLSSLITSGGSLEYSLYEWSVSDKVPSDTFDIPKDYTEVDLEALMESAE